MKETKLGERKCQCGACGKLFASITAFDAHRVGKFKDVHPDYGRRCLSPKEMESIGYVCKSGIWKSATPRPPIRG